ncbi:hypothetical protein [Agrobacterium sp. fls2-241-TYG-188a]|uniref:hypothetical protein n=1 Tax=Agrobacterium sp. fls2-241-TYG-188a TaxID=3040275 RepID=UPI000DE15126|nr:hypothetical protein [Agrobacterium sp. fls2-241-TYG-188a]
MRLKSRIFDSAVLHWQQIWFFEELQMIGLTIIKQVMTTKPSNETSRILLRPSRIALPSMFVEEERANLNGVP